MAELSNLTVAFRTRGKWRLRFAALVFTCVGRMSLSLGLKAVRCIVTPVSFEMQMPKSRRWRRVGNLVVNNDGSMDFKEWKA